MVDTVGDVVDDVVDTVGDVVDDVIDAADDVRWTVFLIFTTY